MNELAEPTSYSSPSSSDRIIYNTTRTEDGWRIEVRFPKATPSSDRNSVLQWFEDYSRSIHKAYPLWSTSFRIAEDGYALDITPNDSARALLNTLQGKMAIRWDEDLIYGR